MSAITSTQAVLLGALQAAHNVLESTVADVDDELANRPAPGVANPVGSAYAHAVLSEDANVSRLSGQAPLCASQWAGRTGTDRPISAAGRPEEPLGDWYRSVKVDMATLRDYTRAVYARSEEFIRSVDDETLGRETDSPLGKMPLAIMFSVFVIGHLNNLSGEVSAIKGAFGRKGYPF